MNILTLRERSGDAGDLERIIRNFWVGLRLGKIDELQELATPRLELLGMVIDRWEPAVAHFKRYRRLDVGACTPVDIEPILKVCKKTASSLFGGKVSKDDRVYLVHITTDTFTPPATMGILLRKHDDGKYRVQRVFDPCPFVEWVQDNNVDISPSADSESSPAA